MRVMLVASILLLSACGSATRVVVLQNPQTKQTVECKVMNPDIPAVRAKQIKDCVKAYKAAGYDVVGDSEK
ncbi:MAG: hypothetical protein Q7W02_19660 [Candidatus Rokubacteria bacterium]|nr:hypothetical protein [Candidatus Rokubacteria bacterium]